MRAYQLVLLPVALAMMAGAAPACDDPGAGASGGAGGDPTTATTSTTAASSTVVTTATTAASSSGAGGSDDGMPSTVYPAPHPAPPRAYDDGGHVLAAPRLIPIFFSNDDPVTRSQLLDFDTKVGASKFWAASTKEYGVGPATADPAIDLPETKSGTIDDTAIQAWLAGKLDSDDPAFPLMPYGDAIFVIHYPADVIITFANGMGGLSHSCQDFGAYHSMLTLDGAHGNQAVAYAVMPVCGMSYNLTGIDVLTAFESHELVEAATDPYVSDGAAYAEIDTYHAFWEKYLGGGEIGDMCTRLPGVFFEFPDLAYTVQRAWSNDAAQAGHDPCVPAIPGAVYFNAAPVQNDDVTTSLFGHGAYAKGTKIPVGETRTIELDLFSDGDPGGPWQVDVEDVGYYYGDTSDLTIQLDRYSGSNGEKLHVTVTVNTPGQDNSELLAITSTLGDTQNVWLALIGN